MLYALKVGTIVSANTVFDSYFEGFLYLRAKGHLGYFAESNEALGYFEHVCLGVFPRESMCSGMLI